MYSITENIFELGRQKILEATATAHSAENFLTFMYLDVFSGEPNIIDIKVNELGETICKASHGITQSVVTINTAQSSSRAHTQTQLTQTLTHSDARTLGHVNVYKVNYKELQRTTRNTKNNVLGGDV